MDEIEAKNLNQKIEVSVAIPTYNEQATIQNILKQILEQEAKTFELKNIIVYLDASTDNTEMRVKELAAKYPKIKLIKDDQRKGKYYRVNQAFRNNTSDILVVFDADIHLVGNDFIEKLIAPIHQNKNLTMVAGRNVFIRPKKILERLIYTKFLYWDIICNKVEDLNSPVNYFGTATAYTLECTKSIDIPAEITDPHLYIYLAANKNKGFFYNKNAQVLQHAITTIQDYKKLLRRSIGKRDVLLERTFNIDMSKIYYIPWKYKLPGLLECFRMYPFYTIPAVLLDIYMERINPPKYHNKTAVWDILVSTKKKVRPHHKS